MERAPLEPNLKPARQREEKQPVHPEPSPHPSPGRSALGASGPARPLYSGPTGSAGLGGGLEGPATGETIFPGMWVSLGSPRPPGHRRRLAPAHCRPRTHPMMSQGDQTPQSGRKKGLDQLDSCQGVSSKAGGKGDGTDSPRQAGLPSLRHPRDWDPLLAQPIQRSPPDPHRSLVGGGHP